MYSSGSIHFFYLATSSNPLCYEIAIPVNLKQQSASGWKLLQAGQLSIPHARPALQSASLSQSPSFSPHFSGKKLQQDPEYGWVAVHPKSKKRQIMFLEKMIAGSNQGWVCYSKVTQITSNDYSYL